MVTSINGLSLFLGNRLCKFDSYSINPLLLISTLDFARQRLHMIM